MEGRIRNLVARVTCGYSGYDKEILLRSKIRVKAWSECKDTLARKRLTPSYSDLFRLVKAQSMERWSHQAANSHAHPNCAHYNAEVELFEAKGKGEGKGEGKAGGKGKGSGVGHSASPNRPSSGQASGAHCPFSAGALASSLGTRHQPHRARSCELVWPAVGAARGRPLGDASFFCEVCLGLATLRPNPLVLGAGSRGPLSVFCGRGGRVRGDPSPTPQRTLLRGGFARCGVGTRAPVGGPLMPPLGAFRVGHPPCPTRPSLKKVVGDRCPLALGAEGAH